MPWDSLARTLDVKPHVLAGPLLRKVTPTSVTVWLALQHADTVTLRVLDPANAVVMHAAGNTIAVGQNLHIICVTATPTSGPLAEGVIYRYDLNFAFQNLTLGRATHGASLAYPAFTMPSFCLPPKDVNSLRLLHGSCRIPHGNGSDALKLADDLIAQSAINPMTRPHQLLLTGDQIYADDVAASMLVMLTDAADVLLGPQWKEKLPFDSSRGGPDVAASAPPILRRYKLKGTRDFRRPGGSGLTSEDLDAHLLSLGEYLCMYLFVWSGALWPGNPDGSQTLPTMQDVLKRVTAVDRDATWAFKIAAKADDIDEDIGDLTEFRSSLPEVRRALANIPSYMIFDDHEVTDDWNMTRAICQGMYSSPLTQQLIQNALVAYALCQHWGNVPEQFANATPPPPGRRLLSLLDKGTDATYATNTAAIRSLVSVHSESVLARRTAEDHSVFHDPNSLIYDYTVEGPGHRVIFTDTRTWRSFPHGGGEAPVLLPKDQLQAQIVTGRDPSGNPPPPDDKILLVVITTNVPPVQSIRTATRYSWLTNAIKHFPDVREAWDLPSVAFDRLIKALTERLPLVGNERKGPIILLSGDVHTGFASRLLYKAIARFEDLTQQPIKATAVIAQLVASSFRKQTDLTEGQHDEGYDYAPHAAFLIPDHAPEGYAGWNLPLSSTQIVGKRVYNFGVAASEDIELEEVKTVPVSAGGNLMKIRVSTPPHFTYRLDYLFATREEKLPDKPRPIPPLPTGPLTSAQRKEAARIFNTATGNYRVYNAGDVSKREIVGLNNLGEITFDGWAGVDKKVNHTLRWWNQRKFHGVLLKGPLMFTTYAVSLNPEDGDFKEIPVDRLP